MYKKTKPLAIVINHLYFSGIIVLLEWVGGWGGGGLGGGVIVQNSIHVSWVGWGFLDFPCYIVYRTL